jgi:peptidoglycan hydrolase-like protein with peptidoglycan-binding domain
MTVTLHGSVGKHLATRAPGVNLREDVLAVQRLLNEAQRRGGPPRHPIREDGMVGVQTLGAIRDFQMSRFRWADGLVAPGQVTLEYLNRVAEGRPPASVPHTQPFRPYRAGGFVALHQRMGDDCWAAVATMLVLWREQRAPAAHPLAPNDQRDPIVVEFLTRLGGPYLDIYTRDVGLAPGDWEGFSRACRLDTETIFQDQSVEGWSDRLHRFGPTAVFRGATFRGSREGYRTHARIVVGIHGDGSVNNTHVVIVDPADGSTDTQPFYWFDRQISEVGDPIPQPGGGQVRLPVSFWHN